MGIVTFGDFSQFMTQKSGFVTFGDYFTIYKLPKVTIFTFSPIELFGLIFWKIVTFGDYFTIYKLLKVTFCFLAISSETNLLLD